MHACYSMPLVTSGLGFALNTYAGEGERLPPFTGDPYPLPLFSDGEATAQRYFDCLHPDRRVAVAVKTISLASNQVEYVIVGQS
jgi:IMP cyclohydrolase